MLSFNLLPFIGAAPLLFGMSKATVHELLGKPAVKGKGSESWGSTLELNVGFTNDETVNHFGLSHGAFELRFREEVVWEAKSRKDPNWVFLRFDSKPLDRLGFLVFTTLGITTTGFHDDDPSQYAVTVFPPGAWDVFLRNAKKPDLSKYSQATFGNTN